MIELKRLKLINWHNFENVTFDCARLTYMIGVNAVGKTTILDAIRYCLTTNRNFNALGNKKSGRTLQGSVHAKQRGENAYRRPGHTVAYIGAEFYDSLKRTPFVIAVRVESEGPMQELHPGDQTWYLSEDGCTLEQLPFIDPRTGAPSAKEDFKPAVGRLSYTRSPSEARDRICRALGIGRASSPLGKKFNEVFQMGTSMDEIPNFREFLYQYILPQPELDLEALQGDRLELENLHAVLAEAQTRADALEEIVNYGREAAGKQTEALVNRGAALLARAAADGGEQDVWQGHLDAGHRQLEALNARYAEAKNAEAEARRAYLAAHSAAGASGEGRALDAMEEELSRRKTAQDAAARKAAQAEDAASKAEALLTALRRSGFASGWKLENLTADPAYERQVDALMEKIMADVDENTRARQEGRTGTTTLSDYVDYRTYLDYDIKVTNRVTGQQAYLSRVSRDSSGGENQAPFYVAICASLLQIYQKSENSIRLVLLDEAFSKMTSDRIRPMMELFRRLQLQVLLISTVEKSTAIQPYCDITYSIVRHGDANAIAPFVRLSAE